MSLEITNYRPNFSDKRVIKRITSVLGWASNKLHIDAPFECHRDTIRSVFGQNDLGTYLVANLLQRSSSHYVVGQVCYTYRINRDGFVKLLCRVQEVTDVELAVQRFSVRYACELYADELNGLKSFEYNDKSYRLYHDLQNYPREIKAEIFKGWNDYDISAACPSIFFNLHRNVQAAKWNNEDVRLSMMDLPYVERYLAEKKQIRESLATELGISLDDAKRIINGLFQGMRLAPVRECKAFKLLGYNPKALNALRSNEFITGLRKDIRKFWNITAKQIGRDRFADGLDQIKKNLLYFFYERKILDVVKSYLEKTGLIFFLEHDGFRVRGEIDLVELEEVVLEKTGFKIKWD